MVALPRPLVHVESFSGIPMVYLSANGEVLGQFEERELPSLLAAGRFGPDAFFWREGMPEWRPLRELVMPPRPQRVTPAGRPSAPHPAAAPAPSEPHAPAQTKQDPALKPVKPAIVQKKPFVPRTPVSVTSVHGAAQQVKVEPEESPARANQEIATASPKPTPLVQKIFLPQKKESGSPAVVAPVRADPEQAKDSATEPANRSLPAGSAISLTTARQKIPTTKLSEPLGLDAVPAQTAPAGETATDPAPPVTQPWPAKAAPVAPTKPAKRGRKALLFLALIPLLAALGVAAWWFFPVQPPALRGEVRLPGPDGALVPAGGAAVLLVSQQELAAHWRERLAEAQSRAAEVDELLKPAKAAHREKVLAFELAARTSELADEYNMPDAAELRAARDAAQSEEAAAQVEVEKLTREKESATGPAAVLREPPEAIDQTQTDETGAFQLLLPQAKEGLVVLVLSGADGEHAAALRGWLVPLDGAEERTEPARLSADNALDAEQINQVAGAQP